MPLLLLLLGASAVGGIGGFLAARKLSKELEVKKAYAECVKELVKKGKKPREASYLCLYSNPTLDIAKLLLLTASVSASLIAVNFLVERLGGRKNATRYSKLPAH